MARLGIRRKCRFYECWPVHADEAADSKQSGYLVTASSSVTAVRSAAKPAAPFRDADELDVASTFILAEVVRWGGMSTLGVADARGLTGGRYRQLTKTGGGFPPGTHVRPPTYRR